jgi:hypothetical protein
MLNDYSASHIEILNRSLLEGNLSWANTVDSIGRSGEVERHYHKEFAFVVGSQRFFFNIQRRMSSALTSCQGYVSF